MMTKETKDSAGATPVDSAAEDIVKLTVRLPTIIYRQFKASCALSRETMQKRIQRLVLADLEKERAPKADPDRTQAFGGKTARHTPRRPKTPGA